MPGCGFSRIRVFLYSHPGCTREEIVAIALGACVLQAEHDL